jgi:hypothetical protein
MNGPEELTLLRNLERRVDRIEQFLPSLATREEVNTAIRAAVEPLPTREEMHAAIRAAVEPLPTRDEMHTAIQTAIRAAVEPLPTRQEMNTAIQIAIQAAVEPLATRQEMHAAMREEGERTRRHFDIVVESLRDDIRLIAEGHHALDERQRASRTELLAADGRLDERVRRLEAWRASSRRRR